MKGTNPKTGRDELRERFLRAARKAVPKKKGIIETLSTYVPQLVLHRLYGIRIIEPAIDSMTGAVLFTDISGFTTLTETVTRKGPEGMEQLTSILNTYFGKIIDIVTSFGGDLINFAGDGVLVLWKLEKMNEGEQEKQILALAHTAVQCSLYLQEQMSNFRVDIDTKLDTRIPEKNGISVNVANSLVSTLPEESVVYLKTHTGVGLGEVNIYYVGGVNDRWMYFLGGSAVEQLSSTVSAAESGQVVVSPQVWAVCHTYCNGQKIVSKKISKTVGKEVGKELVKNTQSLIRATSVQEIPLKTNNDNVLLKKVIKPMTIHFAQPESNVEDIQEKPPEGYTRLVSSYIPEVVMKKLQVGQNEWIGELRVVTIVFININKEVLKSIDLMNRAVIAIQTAMYKYEGNCNKFIFDDKGLVSLCALGLEIGHPDDAIRAVTASLFAKEKLEELDVKCSIGIATGRVFCGSYGNEVRHDYSVIGKTVNLASRLMSVSENTVVCDESTFEASKDKILYDKTDKQIKVKGFDMEIRVYTPSKNIEISNSNKGLISTTFIGRAREKTLVAELMQKLKVGKEKEAKMLIIEGEAGIGKSRFLSEILRIADNFLLKSVITYADSFERSSPLFAFKDIFLQLFNLKYKMETNEKKSAAEIVKQTLSSYKLDLKYLPLLNDILPFGYEENELTSQLNNQARAESVADFLLRILKIHAKENPLVFIIDDANWLDSTSWALSVRICQQVTNILFIIATRPIENPPAEYSIIRNLPNAQPIRIGMLTRSEIVSLVCKQLDVEQLPREVEELLREKAQGSPFYASEICNSLLESKAIIVENGKCNIPLGIADFEKIPETIQGLITNRIDLLSPSAQLVLKVASVIGRTFSYDILFEIFPVKETQEHLKQYLSNLASAGLINKLRSYNTYTFKNAAILECCYNLLLPSQTQQLHQAIAQWYEDQYKPLSEVYYLLASHCLKANNNEKALSYLELAGQKSLDSFANVEAADFFSQVLAVSQKVSQERRISYIQKAHWERCLGEALYNLGRFKEALQHLTEVLSLVDKPMPTGNLRIRVATLFQLSVQFLHRLQPNKYLGSKSSDSHILQEVASTFILLNKIFFLAQKKLPNLYATFRGLNLIELAGPSTKLSISMSTAAPIFGVLGLESTAENLIKQALFVANNLSSEIKDTALASCYLPISYFRVAIGQFEVAEQLLGQCMQICIKLGDTRLCEECLMVKLNILEYTGRFKQSMKLSKELLQSARSRGDQHLSEWATILSVNSLLALEGVDEALKILEDSEQWMNNSVGSTDPAKMAAYYAVFTLALCRGGRRKDAILAANHTLKWLSPIEPTGYFLLSAYYNHTSACLTLWETSPKSDSKNAKKRVLASVEMFKRFKKNFKFSLCWFHLVNGRMQWLLGKRSKAKEIWKAALLIGQSQANEYEQGLALLELGRHEVGEDRTRNLLNAHKIFEKLESSFAISMVKKEHDL